MNQQLLIDDNEDERTKEAARWLNARLANFRARRFDGQYLHELEALLKDHHNLCKRRGIRFPDLCVIPLPWRNACKIVRRDLDKASVAQIIMNLHAEYPGITMEEIGIGMQHAFPRLFPPPKVLEIARSVPDRIARA